MIKHRPWIKKRCSVAIICCCLKCENALHRFKKFTIEVPSLTDRHNISDKCPSNCLTLAPDMRRNWYFACFHAPSIWSVQTTSFLVLIFLYNFWRNSYVKLLNVWIQEKSGRNTQSINPAVNGGTKFNMSLDKGNQCSRTAICHRVYAFCPAFALYFDRIFVLLLFCRGCRWGWGNNSSVFFSCRECSKRWNNFYSSSAMRSRRWLKCCCWWSRSLLPAGHAVYVANL